MLPLDNLSEAAVRALVESGRSPENLSVALQMDLDFDGNFGESWLIYDPEKKSLIRLLADPDSIPKVTQTMKSHAHDNFENFGKTPPAQYVKYLDEFSFEIFSDMLVDTFMSSNRLLMLKHDTPKPDTEGMSKEEADKTMEEWNKGAVTEIVGYCTNSKRQRLFAFRDIVERIQRGDNLTEEDQIFEQFNAKCPKCGKRYENQYRRICTNCSNKGDLIRRLLGFLKPFKLQVFTVICCMVASSAISLISPIINGQILYDRVIDSDGDWHTLTKLFIVLSVIVGLALLSLGVGILQNRANARLSTRMTKNMKQKVFDCMLHLSLRYFNDNPTGRLISRVNYDAERIQSFYIDGLPHFIVNTVNLIGLTIFLFSLNWKMTLMVFIPVPIIIGNSQCFPLCFF